MLFILFSSLLSFMSNFFEISQTTCQGVVQCLDGPPNVTFFMFVHTGESVKFNQENYCLGIDQQTSMCTTQDKLQVKY